MTMDRKDFYYGQKVQQGELDSAFDQVDDRFRRSYKDYGNRGVAPNSGGFGELDIYPDSPNSLFVNVEPGFAYTTNGDRIEKNTTTLVTVGIDKIGASTIPVLSNKKKFVSIFIVPKYEESDPRLDKNNNPVNFHKEVSYQIEVEGGAELDIGDPLDITNNAAPLRNDAILLLDILVLTGHTAITAGDFFGDRRQLSTGNLHVMNVRENLVAEKRIKFPNDNGSFYEPRYGWAESLPIAWGSFDVNGVLLGGFNIQGDAAKAEEMIVEGGEQTRYEIDLVSSYSLSIADMCCVCQIQSGNHTTEIAGRANSLSYVFNSTSSLTVVSSQIDTVGDRALFSVPFSVVVYGKHNKP